MGKSRATARHLDEANLVGGLEGLLLGHQADVGLLVTSGADEGADLGGIKVVERLDGGLDLGLCGAHVADEDEGVVVLDAAHGALRVEGEADDGMAVEGVVALGDGATRVRRLPGQGEGLWAFERRIGADALGGCLLDGPLGDGLFGFEGLCDGG